MMHILIKDYVDDLVEKILTQENCLVTLTIMFNRLELQCQTQSLEIYPCGYIKKKYWMQCFPDRHGGRSNKSKRSTLYASNRKYIIIEKFTRDTKIN